MKSSASSRSGGRGRKNAPGISAPARARKLDALHDAGEELTAHLDLEAAQRPGRVVRRVNVDFPEDLLAAIDREARRIGVTRQAFIKIRLADAVE